MGMGWDGRGGEEERLESKGWLNGYGVTISTMYMTPVLPLLIT